MRVTVRNHEDVQRNSGCDHGKDFAAASFHLQHSSPTNNSNMFRNQYDTDVTVWSPEGRLLQVGISLTRMDGWMELENETTYRDLCSGSCILLLVAVLRLLAVTVWFAVV